MRAVKSAGAEVELILLREYQLSFALIAESALNRQVIYQVNVCIIMGWKNWLTK